MSHKDPMTGCIVADLFEVITPDEFHQMMLEKDADEKQWVSSLEINNEAWKYLLEFVEEANRENLDFPYPVPVTLITTQIDDAGFGSTGGWMMKGVITAIDENGTTQQYKFHFSHDSGTYWQPPDDIWEVEMIEGDN